MCGAARDTPKGQLLKDTKLIVAKPFTAEQINSMCVAVPREAVPRVSGSSRRASGSSTIST